MMKKYLWLLIPAALLLIGLAVSLLLPGLSPGLEAYELLKTYAEKESLRMELSVDAQIADSQVVFSAQVERSKVDEHTVTTVSMDGMTLYCTDGVILLGDGSAYRLGERNVDYAQLLELAVLLFKDSGITVSDGVYSVTAEGTAARTVWNMFLPETAAADRLSLSLTAENKELTQIRFSGSGNGAQLTAVLEILDTQPTVALPAAVQEAVRSGAYLEAVDISEPLLRLVSAGMELSKEDPLTAEMTLSADCGPLAFQNGSTLHRWKVEDQTISKLQTGSVAVYFTDSAICDENGHMLSFAQTNGLEVAQLIGIAWQLCMNGQPEFSGSDGDYRYSLKLEEDGIRAVAGAIAPETEQMDVLFDEGSIDIEIIDGQISRINVAVSGQIQMLLVTADVSLGAEMTLIYGSGEEIPEAVLGALGS